MTELETKIKESLIKGFNDWREKGGDYWDAMMPSILQLIHQRDGELERKLENKIEIFEKIKAIHPEYKKGVLTTYHHAIQLVTQQGESGTRKSAETEENCICHCHGLDIDTCTNKTRCKYRKCKHCIPEIGIPTESYGKPFNAEKFMEAAKEIQQMDAPTEEDSR